MRKPTVCIQYKDTWVEPEECAGPLNRFLRKARVRDSAGNLIRVKCKVADTVFSIPAFHEHVEGFLALNNDGELQFYKNKG